MVSADPPRRARAAVTAFFFLNGLVLASWVVSIPAIEQSLHISHATLGGLLLVLGLGSFAGMQAAGYLVDRIGSRRVTIVGAAILVAGVNLPGLVAHPWQLAAALFVLGLGNGITDVAMNHQAVLVERQYARPIMSSFHAVFSIGGAVGAVVGSIVKSADQSVHWSLGIGALAAAIVTVACAPSLVASPAATDETGRAAPLTRPAAARKQLATRIIALAALAFLLMLAEGTANDWSALQAVERLDQSESAAALAYGSFAVAMTIGRFAADPISHRVGARKVVSYGSAVAAGGMLVIVVSSVYPVTLLGWAVLGVGLSGIVPQIFTAAGNLGASNQGAVMARIVGAGYLGLLAGPAVIGWLSHYVGITNALIMPLAFCIVGITLASQVTPNQPTTPPDLAPDVHEQAASLARRRMSSSDLMTPASCWPGAECRCPLPDAT